MFVGALAVCPGLVTFKSLIIVDGDQLIQLSAKLAHRHRLIAHRLRLDESKNCSASMCRIISSFNTERFEIMLIDQTPEKEDEPMLRW